MRWGVHFQRWYKLVSDIHVALSSFWLRKMLEKHVAIMNEIFHIHFPVHRGIVCFRRWLQPFCSKANVGLNHQWSKHFFLRYATCMIYMFFVERDCTTGVECRQLRIHSSNWTQRKSLFFLILCCEILKYAWFAWFRCIQFSEDHPKLYQTVVVVFLVYLIGWM